MKKRRLMVLMVVSHVFILFSMLLGFYGRLYASAGSVSAGLVWGVAVLLLVGAALNLLYVFLLFRARKREEKE